MAMLSIPFMSTRSLSSVMRGACHEKPLLIASIEPLVANKLVIEATKSFSSLEAMHGFHVVMRQVL